MNNFNIQSLVLTAVIVMVYAASIKPPRNIILRGHIYDDANELYENIGENFMVLKPRGTDDKSCVKEFFCLAEKALNETSLAKSNLTRDLQQYNEFMNITCHPAFDGKCHVKKLLRSIRQCAKL